MSFVDVKYINLVSSRLRNFKKKDKTLWNFSCPICGDSEKYRLKARGYIYQKQNKFFYTCYNCGVGTTFSNFLKTIDEILFKDYIKENFISSKDTFVQEKVEEVVKKNEKFKIDLPSIASLSNTNEAQRYLASRAIPKERWSDLYYTKKFKEWANTLSSDLFENTDLDFSAIVIPFISEKKELVGFQGRKLSTSSFRYSTVRLRDDVDMVYGMDRVDLTKLVYIVEGPFDSMFLPNAIALRSASVKIPQKILDANNFVIVFDNEPRNLDIIKQMKAYIEKGYKVCIWDHKISKDINQSILDGFDIKYILNYINNNTCEKLMAQLELNNWGKVKERYHAETKNDRRTAFGIS